ncbi:hypothetical protein KQX54_010767 [Cotesia glomerata]|uniref:Uncharacterized protein n=1 Tax=Cotesia glomerata TaxID=32391 RepID=A0AAV7J4H9_COTGL|nr:hypothetical protein KQX54_010767 [Cotesia glomerata]
MDPKEEEGGWQWWHKPGRRQTRERFCFLVTFIWARGRGFALHKSGVPLGIAIHRRTMVHPILHIMHTPRREPKPVKPPRLSAENMRDIVPSSSRMSWLPSTVARAFLPLAASSYTHHLC